MKREKSQKGTGWLNDRGFSLVELLISIAVLVIIMVPLMNNFFRSMQMNKKAEKLQIQSNLAASIMEGLKTSDMATIIEQFTGPSVAFDLISEEIDGVNRLYNNGGIIQVTPPPIEQATYYFAINKIKVGSTAYDAFITIDPISYKDDVAKIMNSYPMPEPINLDEKANALLFSNGSENGAATTYDDTALETFRQWGRAYAQIKLEQSPEYLSYLSDYNSYLDIIEENALKTPRPADPPMPIEPKLESIAALPGNEKYLYYFDTAYISAKVTKTMRITVNGRTVNYDIEYFCDWPKGSNELQSSGEDSVQSTIVNHISTKSYSNTVENVYLFYKPSIFLVKDLNDVALLTNQDGANAVNFYVANQESVSNKVKISREGSNVSVYTNLPTINYSSYVGGTAEIPSTVNQKVVRTKQKDRIYQVNIDICKYIDTSNLTQKYHEVQYTLEGTIEE